MFSSVGLRRTWANFLSYDVTPDGQQFVDWERVGEEARPSIRSGMNWFAEFRDREQD